MKVSCRINKLAKDAAWKFNRFGNVFVLLSLFIMFISDIAAGSQHDVRPSSPNDCKVQNNLEPLTYLSVRGNKILNQNGKEIKLRGVHYDCFYVLPKKVNDAIKRFGEDPDEWNVKLSKYFFTENDIAQLKNLCVNVVRLEFRLWEIEKKPYSYSRTSLAHLDETIAKLGKNGIYVILDLHAAGQNRLKHNREYGNVLWDDEDFHNRVIWLWGILADRYKDNPYVAGYDVINEPQAPTKKALHSFYQRVIERIRKVDKKHTLFIEWNLYDKRNILFGGEYNDPNIALSIHFYKPSKFAMQGIGGRPIGQKYPGSYDGLYWDKRRIDMYFQRVLTSYNPKGRPLFVGEFAASPWAGDDGMQWIRDVIEVFNSKGIHYTFFNYKVPSRSSWGYYLPTPSVNKRIKKWMQGFRKRDFSSKLKEEQKRLLLTENFEAPEKLGEILKQGFEGKE